MARSRLSFCAALAAVTFLGVGASAHAASGPLLVLDAQGLTAHAGSDDSSTVVLRDVVRPLTSFTRGARAPEIDVTVGELTRQWKALGFDASPPLATIDPGGDRRGATLVRLGQPRLRGDDLVLHATPVPGSGGALAGRLRAATTKLPATAGETTVTLNATEGDPDGLAAINDPLIADRDGEWTQVTFQLSAGDHPDTGCGGGTWGVGGGSCRGHFLGGLAPLNPATAPWGVAEWGSGTFDLQFTAAANSRGEDPVAILKGFSPSRDSDFWVESGWLWRSHHFPVRTGGDPALDGQMGGPLDMDVKYVLNGGYSLIVTGFVYCFSGDAACKP
jgi:hypothetical protein